MIDQEEPGRRPEMNEKYSEKEHMRQTEAMADKLKHRNLENTYIKWKIREHVKSPRKLKSKYTAIKWISKYDESKTQQK